MSTRAEKIQGILSETAKGRLRVRDILAKLQKLEGTDGLHPSSVPATVRQDNKTRRTKGLSPRFNYYGDGEEERGYVSLATTTLEKGRKQIIENAEDQLPLLIEAANDSIKNKLREAILKLTWEEFESNFLTQVLDALGFSSVEITQKTRDGGKDAECEYKRGIVSSRAIVSAKHWAKGGASVPVEEVQRMRGINSEADTAVIVTSSKFSGDAQKEAEPQRNARSVVLVDGVLIVEACFDKGIGVEEVDKLPKLYRFTGFEEPEDSDN